MLKAANNFIDDALRFNRRNMLRVSLAILLSVLVTGCSTLYVHDSAIEKSMTDARTAFDSAKVNDVFDRQSKYFDQLQAKEIAIVKARDAAQRDSQLLLFLTGNEGIDGLTLMSNDIEMRLMFLYGPDPDPKHSLWRRISNMELSASMDKTINDGYERAVRDYRSAKGTRPTDCISVLAGSIEENDRVEADKVYSTVKKRCEDLKKAIDLEATQMPTSPPEAKNGMTTIEFGALLFPLNYFVAQKQLFEQQSKLKAKKDAAAELGKELDKAQKTLETSLATGTTTQQQMNYLIKQIHDAMSQVESYLENPYAKKVVSNKLATEIQTIIDASGTPAVTGTSAPSASAAATTSATGDVVSATATTAATEQPQQSEKIRASLAVLQAAVGVGDAFSDPPRVPHPNVLAVGRAQMSYSRDIAIAEVNDLEAEVDASRLQLNAITTAVYMLSRAQTEINWLKDKKVQFGEGQGLSDLLAKKDTSTDVYRHAVAALFYYTTAWNRGQVLADEIEIERNIASRRSTMERGRRATKAWVETIKPGLDTLVAYGNGGIDPKTVAQIIGSLGIVATGIGVNR